MCNFIDWLVTEMPVGLNLLKDYFPLKSSVKRYHYQTFSIQLLVECKKHLCNVRIQNFKCPNAQLFKAYRYNLNTGIQYYLLPTSLSTNLSLCEYVYKRARE